MSRLSSEAINHLHEAALVCGLNRDALLCGIDPRFVAQLQKFEQLGAQFHADLHALNKINSLEDGSDPLRTWLIAAHAMAYPREQTKIFRQYRDHLVATETMRAAAPDGRSSNASGPSPRVEGHQPTPAPGSDPYPDSPEFPRNILKIYPRLWQLETWLRRVTYVELRTLLGDDWMSNARDANARKAAHDKLIHMPTRREGIASYLSLPDLCKTISDNWQLFEYYFPPQPLWEAKVEEVSQIRDRVLQFRSCHRDDLQRVNQLLRDLDPGMLRFCDALNSPFPLLPSSADPVVERFIDLDPFPWTCVRDNSWARTGFADPDALFGMTIELLSRPWCSKFERPAAGKPGLLYNVVIHPRQGRRLDYRGLLSRTAKVHKHVVYISLACYSRTIRLILPTVLGAEKCIEVIAAFVDSVQYAISSRGELRDETPVQLQAVADAWPGYVAGPEDLVTQLDSETCSTVFGGDV